MGNSELLIKNKLPVGNANNVKVRIYPIGFIFASEGHPLNSFMEYTPYVNSSNFIVGKEFSPLLVLVNEVSVTNNKRKRDFGSCMLLVTKKFT